MILTLFGYGPGVFWRSYSSLVAELLIWKEFPSIAGRINFNVWPNFGLWKAALRSTTALAVKSASLKVTADNMHIHRTFAYVYYIYIYGLYGCIQMQRYMCTYTTA